MENSSGRIIISNCKKKKYDLLSLLVEVMFLIKKNNHTNNKTSNGTFAPSSSPSATPTATFIAAVPTYTPLNDCPDSNDTGYTSSFSNATDPQPSAGLQFTKFCNLSNPIREDSQRIAEVFVYSFSDCVEVCASYNYYSDSGKCTVAVYQPDAPRPGNCWTGSVGDVQASALNATRGTEVALLNI